MTNKYNISCPIENADGDPCDLDIAVYIEPGARESHHEPGYMGQIDTIETDCGHAERLMSGEYDTNLWRQIEALDEQAYDDAQEARVDRERDRWADDY